MHMLRLFNDFRSELTDYIKGENDKKDLALMISDADRRLLDSVKCSIGQFGLADHDERQQGLVVKFANDILFLLPKCTSLTRVYSTDVAVEIDSHETRQQTGVSNESDDDLAETTPSRVPNSTPRGPGSAPRRARTCVPRLVPETPPAESPMAFNRCSPSNPTNLRRNH
jgi:hypothetical protein